MAKPMAPARRIGRHAIHGQDRGQRIQPMIARRGSIPLKMRLRFSRHRLKPAPTRKIISHIHDLMLSRKALIYL
jgi:hypothetical protein